MYEREKMKFALGALSWRKVIGILGADQEPSAETYGTLIEDVVRTGCLTKKTEFVASVLADAGLTAEQ